MSIFGMRQWFGGERSRSSLGVLPLVFIVMCFAGYGAYTGNKAGNSEGKLAAAAVVKGVELPGAVYKRNLDDFYDKQKDSGYSILMEEQMRAQVLSSLVDKMLLAREATREGFDVSNGDINTEIDKLATQDVQQERMRSGMSESDFETSLQRSGQNISGLENDARTKYQSDAWRPEIEWDLDW